VGVLIELHDVARYYQMGDERIAALDGVSFAIETGEMVAIVGSSGSGKSTLLNILGCLDTPSRGQYTLGGRDVQDLSDDERARVRNRQIGFVFQSFCCIAPAHCATSRCRWCTAGSRRASATAGPPRRWPGSGCRTGPATSRSSCRAASASAPRSRGRWSPSRRCCCATSRPATSTRRGRG
jgi:hypothetical protein